MLTVAVTVRRDDIDRKDFESESGPPSMRKSDIVLFFLTLVLSVLSSVVAFYQPSQRWRRLRSFAQRMEAAIWAYRTRTGDFEERKGQRRRPDEMLRAAITSIRMSAIEANELDRTAWTAAYPPHVYKHGQRAAPASTSGPACASRVAPLESPGAAAGMQKLPDNHFSDKHFSPLRPDAYISVRIEVMIEFFQSRLPRYSRAHACAQIALVLFSSTGAALAFLGHSKHVAIVSAVAAAVTAWVEFHAAADKLQRYNASITQLQNLVTWWQSLSDIERAGSPAITRLVVESEDVLASELRAWGSTSVGQHGDGGGEDGAPGSGGGGKAGAPLPPPQQ